MKTKGASIMAATGGDTSVPGDLGRRVAHRRRELGLSREQLAERAAMAPGYVEYLEDQAAQVPFAATARLALALNTSVDELLGGAVELPPGQRGAGVQPRLEALNERECRRLLAAGGVGRLVFIVDRRPVALPVNYRMLEGDVVFRTAEETTLGAVSDAEPVSFEVDRVDEAMSEGWSVLVTGRLRRVSPDELRRLEKLGVEPWAGGPRSVYLRLELREVSGRRIRAGP
jgi:nitroimidazol reductase NimA-like FMN-containing flavoprotein (pyridoxamine 5'-phosphate oxidase superfamily)